jgi:hypothetical protein
MRARGGPVGRRRRRGPLGPFVGAVVVGAACAAAGSVSPAGAVTVDSPWPGWQTVGPAPSLRGEAAVANHGATVAIRLRQGPGPVPLVVRSGARWRHVVAPVPEPALPDDPVAPGAGASAPSDSAAAIAVPGPRALVLYRGCGVVHSDDLGGRWTRTGLPGCDPGDPGRFTFADELHGIVAVGRDSAAPRWSTADGGRTWSGPLPAAQLPWGTRRGFRTGESGAATGSRPIEVTQDGGATWRPVTLRRPDGTRAPIVSAPAWFWAVGSSGTTGVFLATAAGRYVSDDDGLTFADAPGVERWTPPDPGDGSWSGLDVACDRGVCHVELGGSGKGGSISAGDSWTVPAWVARGDVAPPTPVRYRLDRTLEEDDDGVSGAAVVARYGCPATTLASPEREPVVLNDGDDDDPLFGGATTVGPVGPAGEPALLAGGRLWTTRSGRWWRVTAPGSGCVRAVVTRGSAVLALVGPDGTDDERVHLMRRGPGVRWHSVARLGAREPTDVAWGTGGALLALPAAGRRAGGVAQVRRGRVRLPATGTVRAGGFARVDARDRVAVAWRGSRPRVSGDGGRTWRPVRGLRHPTDVQVVDSRRVVAIEAGRLRVSARGDRSPRPGVPGPPCRGRGAGRSRARDAGRRAHLAHGPYAVPDAGGRGLVRRARSAPAGRRLRRRVAPAPGRRTLIGPPAGPGPGDGRGGLSARRRRSASGCRCRRPRARRAAASSCPCPPC